MDNDTLYSSVLDSVYISMPSLPGLVLMARKLNIGQGKEDTTENAFHSIASMTKLLCTVDLSLLEKKHRENTAEVQPLATPKKNCMIGRAEKHLEEVTSLDRRIRAANESLKASIDENRNMVTAGRNVVETTDRTAVSIFGMEDSFGAVDTGFVSPWLLRPMFDENDDALGMLLRQCTMDENDNTTEPITIPVIAEAEAAGEAAGEAATEAAGEVDENVDSMPVKPTRLLRSSRVGRR